MTTPSACPSFDQLYAFALGQLPDEALVALRAHIVTCSPCGEAVAAAARGQSTGASPSTVETRPRDPARVEELQPGAPLGRYLVIEQLGKGAMGAVYSARDPELERRVAIKVLRWSALERIGIEELRSRLRREAQAMARLSHPNVVPVFEIGETEDRLYLVMELVEGQTLARWLRSKRSKREILEKFIGAGEGLAAAHAAGVIHRDFKPENVLVGNDGRARVTDFGLARGSLKAGAEDSGPMDSTNPANVSNSTNYTNYNNSNNSTHSTHSTAPKSSQDPARPGAPDALAPAAPSSTLTPDGAILGTPAYMSPEQYQGRSPDARADQFSFCVALYEALYEKRPFEARTAYELANKVILGELDRTPAGKVPPWLREVVVRGLRPRAEERFSSMRELIDALKNDPGAVRRKWLGAAAVVALLALVGAFELQLRQRRQLCRGGNAALAAVWNPERAAQAKASFLATGLPFAAYAFDQVERALDGYGHAWVAMHGEACEATRLRGEQSEEVLDLRMSCLSQHLQGLQASAGLFASADRQVVEKSAQVIAGLAPLSECSNVEALQTPLRPPKDAEQRANVEEVRAQLAQAIALRASAQYQKALLVAEAALHRARTLDYPPLTANAMLGLGDLQGSLRDDAAAHDTLSDAFETALASRDDLTASRAATRLLYLANVRGHPDEGHLWARLSGALLQRGAFEPLERARLDLQLGSLFSREARLDQALDHLRSALALFQGAHAAAEAATTRSAIAQVLRRQGKFPDALQEFELVLRSEEALLGAEHPDVGDIHDNIGAILQQQGKADEALVEMRRALAIYEKSLAPSHPRIAGAHINLAWMLLSQDKLPEALDEVRTGLALQEQARGSDQLEQAATDLTLGIILWRLGRFEEALVALRRGLALHDSAWGPEHIEAANYHLEIGIVLGDQGHFDEALEEMRLALAILNKSPGADPGEIGRVRDSMGSVLNSQGKPQLAMNEFRAALAIKEKVLGAEHPNTAITIGNIGESELKIGEYAQASEHLGRALSILEVKLPVPSVLGEFRFALAQSRWAAKRERPGAVALARQALGDFAKVQGTEKQTAEIEHWLGGHASMPAPR